MTDTPAIPDEPGAGAIPTVEKGHPRGLYVLFGTEMWERFGYYGMRALLGMYMINALGFTQDRKSIWYGWYTGLVYMTPIIGGWIADHVLGLRRTILIGAVLMMAGYFLLMSRGGFNVPFLDAPAAFVVALGLLIVG